VPCCIELIEVVLLDYVGRVHQN
jgi:D-alanine-D-alanine ligase-like ATP-grasp enzyme